MRSQLGMGLCGLAGAWRAHARLSAACSHPRCVTIFWLLREVGKCSRLSPAVSGAQPQRQVLNCSILRVWQVLNRGVFQRIEGMDQMGSCFRDWETAAMGLSKLHLRMHVPQ